MMTKSTFNNLMKMHIVFMLLLLATVDSTVLKAFNNPLNNKEIDIYLAVDEGGVTNMNLGLIKTTLYNIALELNPPGSTLSFSAYFYGATTNVDAVVQKASTAAVVKSKLEMKQHLVIQSNPSTLLSALNSIESHCLSYCRFGVARVLVIISSSPDSLAEGTIRRLERDRGLTVIVVGVGATATEAVMDRLASQPSKYYSVAASNFFGLGQLAQHIADMASDVPRLLDINTPLSTGPMSTGVYHTVQLNAHEYTNSSDAIVMFASNCGPCPVYGSLNEPNPISANAAENIQRHNIPSVTGYANFFYYFQIPRNTGRFYISIQGSGMASGTILLNVFPTPALM